MKIESWSLGPFETNAYLLTSEDGKSCAVVDAPRDAGKTLLPEIKKRGLKLTHILITHGHWDHMCDAHAFASAGAQALAHEDDQQLIENIEGYRDRYQSMMPFLTEEDFHSCKVAQWLKQGDSFEALGKKFEVRHVPGHCPGSLLFYCAEEKLAFTGDAIFNGSVGRTDLPNGDWNQLLKSIREQIYTLPEDTNLLPGHGGNTSVGKEKKTNPYARP
jgi:glyoxylase-like metal-dependent hydrolase (beta-lactamase superfamily II)